MNIVDYIILIVVVVMFIFSMKSLLKHRCLFCNKCKRSKLEK